MRGLKFFCLLAVLLCASPAWGANAPTPAQGPANTAQPAAAPVSAPQPAVQTTPDPGVDQVLSAWNALIDTSMNNLAAIRAQANDLQAKLPSLTATLAQSVPTVSSEFQRLAAMAQISRNMPAELSVVAERTRRLTERLDAMTAPLASSMAALSSRLNDLAALDVDAPDAASEALKGFRQELAATKRQITQLQSRITAVLAPSAKLRADIATMQERMESSMPTLWRDYYIAPTSKIFDPAEWRESFARLSSLHDILSLRFSTEMPPTAMGWLFAGFRVLAAMAPFAALMYLGRKTAARAPAAMRHAWQRLPKGGIFWIALGFALCYAAWSEDGMYRFIASLGAITLCWGQMALAWNLDNFGKNVTAEGEPSKTAPPAMSPLWPMFPPLLLGMLLLSFDTLPLLVSIGWLLVLVIYLWRHHKRKLCTEKLPRALLTLFTTGAWVGLLLTLAGFARFSILACAACTALAVCVQQSLALMRVGNALEELQPKDGPRALIVRLMLAVLIPLALLIGMLTPLLWVLAYPGGVYLIRHFAGLGFSVGTVSLNAVQILSIFVAFYLTRLLITVGKTFILGLRGQGVELSPSLIGPLQTGCTYVLWGLFGLYALNSLGFSLTSLAIVAGGLSVGVGFGLQNIVQNFTSGLMVIFGQIIREGDSVEVGGISGTVKRINIRSTQLETGDNAVVFIPNSQFLSNTFTNWTHNGLTVRREVAVGVAYGSDLALCMKLLTQAATQHPKVLAHPAPSVYFTDFGPSSLNLLLRYWIADYGEGMTITTAIRLRVHEVFKEHNIEIAFPQLEVRLANDESKPDEQLAAK